MALMADQRRRFELEPPNGSSGFSAPALLYPGQDYLEPRLNTLSADAVRDALAGPSKITLSEGGDATLSIVAVETADLVVKRFRNGNLVPERAGKMFEGQTLTNGQGLALAAPALDAISAPLGIRIFSPPQTEEGDVLVMPLYQRPNLESLGFAASGNSQFMSSKLFATYADDFLAANPGVDSKCVAAISAAFMRCCDDASLRLKEPDVLVIAAEFVDSPQIGIVVPGKGQLLRATLLLIDLH